MAVIRMVPAGFSRSLTQSLELGLDLLKPRAHGVQQAIARFRWRDAARGAGQEPNSQSRFESPDGVAERRLRNTELCCCFGEAVLSPNDDEKDGRAREQRIERGNYPYIFPPGSSGGHFSPNAATVEPVKSQTSEFSRLPLTSAAFIRTSGRRSCGRLSTSGIRVPSNRTGITLTPRRSAVATSTRTQSFGS